MNDIETVFTTLFRLKSTFAEKRIIVRPKSATLISLSGSNLPSDALTIPLPTAHTTGKCDCDFRMLYEKIIQFHV